MNNYGSAIVVDFEGIEYSAKVISINNPKTQGKRIHAIYYPNDKAQPDEYPELTWDKLILECYDIYPSAEIESVRLVGLQWDEEVEFETDVEVLKTYFDHQANCMVV